MTTKRQLQDWNKQKWERKQHAMYETYAQNKWPWFNDKLDPDIEEYLLAAGSKSLDVLDLGTCSGSQGIELARRGHRVVGTDISETAVAQAKLAAGREPKLAISFLIDDIAESRLDDNQFDLVLDRGCYCSICSFSHEEYVATVRRVLKPRGVLLLKTMSSEDHRFMATTRSAAGKCRCLSTSPKSYCGSCCRRTSSSRICGTAISTAACSTSRRRHASPSCETPSSCPEKPCVTKIAN